MRTLLARRSLRHPLRPHLRTPTPREAARRAERARPARRVSGVTRSDGTETLALRVPPKLAA